MVRSLQCFLILALASVLPNCADGSSHKTEGEPMWEIHDMDRPRPEVVTPPTPSTQKKAGKPPSDAIVLFDGSDLSKWENDDGGAPKWKLADGAMMPVKDSGGIRTKQAFGDMQLHVEWAAPEKVVDDGQDRGNSGVFLMNRYEIQVLDSYNNDTYPDGQAAAVYGQNPPLVNACRPPGEWQTYDIIFHAPRFENEEVVKPATVTVIHNGVLVQDHWEIKGLTRHKQKPIYRPHGEKAPLSLQDHDCPVRYRNIWVRELGE